MPDKTSAIDQFLGDINGQDSFQDPNANPFAEMEIPSGEQQEVPEEPEAKEEKLPFNKDPKIQRFIQKEVARLTKDLTPRETQKFEDEVESSGDVVEAFKTIIGDDTPEKVHALKMLDKTLKGFEEKATIPARQLQAERQAEREAEETLANGFESIEEQFDVDITSNTPQARRTKAEFIEFIETIAPKDEYGEIKEFPDFERSFEIFQNLRAKAQPVTRAKELASRSMARASDASAIPETQGTSWKDVEKMFSKLQG